VRTYDAPIAWESTPTSSERDRAMASVDRSEVITMVRKMSFGPVANRTTVLALAIVGAALAAGVRPVQVSTQASPAEQRYEGPAVSVGHGTARTIVWADQAGAIRAFGVELSRDALDGLPPESNPEGGTLEWHYDLELPKGAPSTGFDHVMINWNPHGHVPPGVYTVPHFDFHFFLIDRARQRTIHYPHEEQGTEGVEPPPASLMAPGYFIPPGTQINQMGVHAVSQSAPELHGHPFATTFIYGYHDRDLVFVEPMISLATLKSQAEVMQEIPVPGAYSFPALYPTRYRVRHDAARGACDVLLEGLRPWPSDR
jgi:hypothetical protein